MTVKRFAYDSTARDGRYWRVKEPTPAQLKKMLVLDAAVTRHDGWCCIEGFGAVYVDSARPDNRYYSLPGEGW